MSRYIARWALGLSWTAIVTVALMAAFPPEPLYAFGTGLITGAGVTATLFWAEKVNAQP